MRSWQNDTGTCAERWRSEASGTRAFGSLSGLEAGPTGRGSPVWETLLMRSGADDDPVLIDLALQVWEALGSNEHAVWLLPRPRTYRGFLAGRAWLLLGILGPVGVGALAVAVQDRWEIPWWLRLPVIAGWPVLVLYWFRRWHVRRSRRGGKELPHF